MLNFSKNIVAESGVLPINNLNVFIKDDSQNHLTDFEYFKECLGRTNFLFNYAMDKYIPDEAYMVIPLTILSTPRFLIWNVRKYQFVGGFFIWNNYLFKPNATFSFDENGSFIIENFDLIVPASLVPMEQQLLHYDTYNQEKLCTIDPKILEELDIPLDLKKYEKENEDEDQIESVKYMSIYAPELNPELPGRVFGYVKGDIDPIYNFDRTYFDSLINLGCYYIFTNYDEFLVEFIDKTQPFAYIAVELIGEFVNNENIYHDEYNILDTFKLIWNNDNKDEFIQHTSFDIIATYERILES
jgi:hypothetical protein